MVKAYAVSLGFYLRVKGNSYVLGCLGEIRTSMGEENEEGKGEGGIQLSEVSSSSPPEVVRDGGSKFVGGTRAELEQSRLTVNIAACKGGGEGGSSTAHGIPISGRLSPRTSPTSAGRWQSSSCWLTETTGLTIPPCKSDFRWVGVMMKRRGGFGKMSASSWKSRCFIVVNEVILCYYEQPEFEDIDFKLPPRGILYMNEEFSVHVGTKIDGDCPTPYVLLLTSGSIKWKLSAMTGEEFSVLLGIVNDAQGSIGNLPSLQFLRLNNSGSSVNMSGSDHGRRRQHSHLTKSQNGVKPYKNGNQWGEPTRSNFGWNGFLAFCVELLAVDIIIVSIKLSPNVWEMLSLPAAVAIINVLIGLLGGQRESLKDAPIGVVAVPLIHADCIERVITYVKMAHVCEGRRTGRGGRPLPIANSTVAKADCTAGDVCSPVHSWLPGVSSMFTVRGKNYLQDKKKCTSAEGLYQAAGVDYYRTDARVSNVCDFLDLESVLDGVPMSSIAGVPSLIVLNTQIPSAAPSLASTSEDGQSYEVIMYFTLTKETAKALENLETTPEAVRLWAKWCQNVPGDVSFENRFKAMCILYNLNDLNLPSALRRCNGKPAIIHKTGKISWGEYKGITYMEFQINVHRFSFLAKKIFYSVIHKMKNFIINVGFTIEGRESEFLPECILGCITLNYPQMLDIGYLDLW